MYFRDTGYSNYTILEESVHCALDRNPNLKDKDVEVPYDWQRDLSNGIHDRWEPTCNSMCERFSPLKQGCSPASFDVEGDVKAVEVTVGFSRAARHAIAKHSGR